MEKDDYFEEEAVKMRAPLLYHMYVGRYSDRNGDVKGPYTSDRNLSKFLLNRVDNQSYELELQSAYQEHLVKYGQSYFEGQLDEGIETDAKGNELKLTP